MEKVRDSGPLETARKSKGLTQSELAERSGVHQGNISAYERGVIPIGVGAAKKLGKVLDTDPAVLVIDSQNMRLKAALDRGDRVAVIQACKCIVEASQELTLEPSDDKALDLDILVAQVVDFTEKVGTRRDPVRDGRIMKCLYRCRDMICC